VAASGLLTVRDARRIEGAADDLVTHAGKVLHAATAYEHDRVLLQVVTDAGDIRRHLDTGGEPHTRDLAQGGVGFLRRRREHARAYAPTLRGALEGRRLGLLGLRFPSLTDELGDRGHALLPSEIFGSGVQSKQQLRGAPRRSEPTNQRSRARV